MPFAVRRVWIKTDNVLVFDFCENLFANAVEQKTVLNGAVEGRPVHIKEVAAQVKPLLAPPVRTLAFLPTLGMFGAGVAVGTGIGMLTAPKPGSELRASLKNWLNGQWQQTVATKNRLFPRPNGKGTQESSGAEPAPN